MKTAIGWFYLQLAWQYWSPETFAQGRGQCYTLINTADGKRKICKRDKNKLQQGWGCGGEFSGNVRSTSTELLRFAHLSMKEETSLEK